MRGCKLKFWETNFIWLSATKSWEKSINFRYGLPEDFFSIGQKTVGVDVDVHFDEDEYYWNLKFLDSDVIYI